MDNLDAILPPPSSHQSVGWITQEEFDEWTRQFKGYVDITIKYETSTLKSYMDDKVEVLRDDIREAFRTYKKYTDDKFNELKEEVHNLRDEMQDLREYVDGKFNRMELMLATLTRHFHLDLPTEEK
jgi:hypothetical protein